jgi:general secretion pathway protein L
LTAIVLVKKQADNYFEWIVPGQQTEDIANGDAESLAGACPTGASVILLAPAEAVNLSIQAFDESEKKVFAKTLPYTLEDDLVEDIEDLHFSFGEVENNTVPLALLRFELLDGWLEELSQAGVELKKIVPEQCLLPWQEGSWTLLIDGDRYLLRNGQFAGFALERDTALLAMQLLVNESELLPESLVIYAGDQDRDELQSLIPDMLSSRLEWKEGTYWDVVAENFPEHAPLNLLQGIYASSLPWRSWWQQWRTLAAVVAATFTLQLIFNYVELSSLQSDNLALRTQIEQSYRKAIPSGKIVEPERQLRRQVNAMKGDNSSGFVALLDKMAPLLAGAEYELQSMNYNGKLSEVRITVLASSFNEVEVLRAKIAEQGLTAEMTGSNTVGDKTRARLRIKG